MNYQQRTAIIGRWLQHDVLPRYTPPTGIDKDALKTELNLAVEDMNSFIPPMNQGLFEAHLTKIDKQLRTTHRGRTWPTIQEFVKATQLTATAVNQLPGPTRSATNTTLEVAEEVARKL